MFRLKKIQKMPRTSLVYPHYYNQPLEQCIIHFEKPICALIGQMHCFESEATNPKRQQQVVNVFNQSQQSKMSPIRTCFLCERYVIQG